MEEGRQWLGGGCRECDTLTCPSLTISSSLHTEDCNAVRLSEGVIRVHILQSALARLSRSLHGGTEVCNAERFPDGVILIMCWAQILQSALVELGTDSSVSSWRAERFTGWCWAQILQSDFAELRRSDHYRSVVSELIS